MQHVSGFGHLDSLVDDIKKKESDRVKLESQLRQLHLRAESEAADASQAKAELEAAQAERMSLQKRIGLLTRKNEDLAAENAKLLEEKCDFQRSMTNNEAKLKQNEDDLRRAQREFVEDLEKANLAYSRNRAVMNTLLGRKGVGCAEVPSPDEVDKLKQAAAKSQETILRVVELEARLQGVEAESLSFKREAAESVQKQESLKKEIISLQEKARNVNVTVTGTGGSVGHSKSQRRGDGGMGLESQRRQHQRLSQLEQEVTHLEETCSRQAEYISQLEEYTNSVEAANTQLMQQQQGGRGGVADEGQIMDDGPTMSGGGTEGIMQDAEQITERNDPTIMDHQNKEASTA